MLANLSRIFAGSGDAERLLACCDRIVLLTPGDPIALRDRALVYQRLGWLAPAIADLEARSSAPPTPTSPRRSRGCATRCARGSAACIDAVGREGKATASPPTRDSLAVAAAHPALQGPDRGTRDGSTATPLASTAASTASASRPATPVAAAKSAAIARRTR